MNAMLVFVMAAQGIFAGFVNGWYYESTDNTLVSSETISNFDFLWHNFHVNSF